VNTEAAFRRHAEIVVDHELRRARGRLAGLQHDRRGEVEELALRVAAELVEGVLEQARDEPILAQALRSIYGPGMSRDLQALPCISD
jgi:glutamyl-tRNA reductase